MKVEINGIEIEVAEDVGSKLIAARQADKEDRRAKAARIAELEAETASIRKAQEEAAQQEEQKLLLGKKKYDEAAAKMKADYDKKINGMSQHLRDRELESLVRAQKDIMPDAVSDIVSLLRASCVYDLDANMLKVMDGQSPKIGADGQPINADAFVGEFISSRPHYRKATVAQGSGGTSAGGGNKGNVLPVDQVMAMPPTQRAQFYANGGSIAS